ncbi:hypothetical protein MRX96_002464 [Rhipicephalus microplus]
MVAVTRPRYFCDTRSLARRVCEEPGRKPLSTEYARPWSIPPCHRVTVALASSFALGAVCVREQMRAPGLQDDCRTRSGGGRRYRFSQGSRFAFAPLGTGWDATERALVRVLTSAEQGLLETEVKLGKRPLFPSSRRQSFPTSCFLSCIAHISDFSSLMTIHRWLSRHLMLAAGGRTDAPRCAYLFVVVEIPAVVAGGDGRRVAPFLAPGSRPRRMFEARP